MTLFEVIINRDDPSEIDHLPYLAPVKLHGSVEGPLTQINYMCAVSLAYRYIDSEKGSFWTSVILFTDLDRKTQYYHHDLKRVVALRCCDRTEEDWNVFARYLNKAVLKHALTCLEVRTLFMGIFKINTVDVKVYVKFDEELMECHGECFANFFFAYCKIQFRHYDNRRIAERHYLYL